MDETSVALYNGLRKGNVFFFSAVPLLATQSLLRESIKPAPVNVCKFRTYT